MPLARYLTLDHGKIVRPQQKQQQSSGAHKYAFNSICVINVMLLSFNTFELLATLRRLLLNQVILFKFSSVFFFFVVYFTAVLLKLALEIQIQRLVVHGYLPVCK